VFTGDTLFAAGCGRLFEGTPAQMFASLRALTALPEATRLWFGHEYTASNLRYAEVAEPDNAAVRDRRANLPACTTPTTVALERATNPFVRAPSVEVLAERRAAKDKF
jgi:hydroxyacylglutathione hydrolase